MHAKQSDMCTSARGQPRPLATEILASGYVIHVVRPSVCPCPKSVG